MWFQRKSAPTIDEPPTAVAAVEPDREAEAHAVVVELKAQLAELDAEMLHFKSKFKIRTDRFSRLLGCESGMSGYAEIEREWRTLLHKRDSLVTQWHAALFRWAEAKELAKAKETA